MEEMKHLFQMLLYSQQIKRVLRQIILLKLNLIYKNGQNVELETQILKILFGFYLYLELIMYSLLVIQEKKKNIIK